MVQKIRAKQFFMIQILDKNKRSVFAILLLMLSGCASLSATRSNLREISAITQEPKKPEKKEQKKKEPLPQQDPNGPIPFEIFLGGATPSTLQSYANRWYPRLLEWVKVYRDIAIDESNLRNYSMSQKYSERALLWAKRSKIIQNMDNEKALRAVEPWIMSIGFAKPDSPTTSHFTALDNYNLVYKSWEGLQGLTYRLCLIRRGFPFVSTIAHYEISNDLMSQKYFSRSTQKIQGVLSSVDDGQKQDKICLEEN